MPDEDALDDKLNENWGEPNYSQMDQDVFNDGVLIPLDSNRDSGKTFALCLI